jgi:hypothetical protein
MIGGRPETYSLVRELADDGIPVAVAESRTSQNLNRVARSTSVERAARPLDEVTRLLEEEDMDGTWPYRRQHTGWPIPRPGPA